MVGEMLCYHSPLRRFSFSLRRAFAHHCSLAAAAIGETFMRPLYFSPLEEMHEFKEKK